MDALHFTHVVFLGLWGGVVAAESVMELGSCNDAMRRYTAQIHYWIDILFEFPLLIGVLVTGCLLAIQISPVSTLHWTKIFAGLIPILVNLFCVVVVIVRYRRYVDSPSQLERASRLVAYCFVAGIPFAALATYLGFMLIRLVPKQL